KMLPWDGCTQKKGSLAPAAWSGIKLCGARRARGPMLRAVDSPPNRLCNKARCAGDRRERRSAMSFSSGITLLSFSHKEAQKAQKEQKPILCFLWLKKTLEANRTRFPR